MNWKITSAEPDNHWGFINFKDKIVLDLGCGKFHSTISTYDLFLQNGAKQVIGVGLFFVIIIKIRFISNDVKIME